MKKQTRNSSATANIGNMISYGYFCLLGGLSNPNARKVLHDNGTDPYFTYHLING